MCYLRGQDGWRHLITKVRLEGDLGLGATTALCYAAATHHWVYILSRDKTQRHRHSGQTTSIPLFLNSP